MLDNNIFKPMYKIMNEYKIKLIRNILNDFYKDKKRYIKDHKIRHTIQKIKKSRKMQYIWYFICKYTKSNVLGYNIKEVFLDICIYIRIFFK